MLQDIDALARNPATNLASAAYIAGATTNNFSQNLPFSKDSISYDIKSDFTIIAEDHLSGASATRPRTHSRPRPSVPSSAGRRAAGLRRRGSRQRTARAVNYDHVFSPTLFTEARVGVAHLRNSAQQTDYGQNDAKTLGIPGNGPNGTDNTPTSSGQVAFNLGNNFSSPLIGYSASLPWLRAESNIDFANNWTKIIGNHTLKAGADIRRVRDDLLQGNNNAAAGQFYFTENQTSAPRCDDLQWGSYRPGKRHCQRPVRCAEPGWPGHEQHVPGVPADVACSSLLSDKWQATPKLTLDIG